MKNLLNTIIWGILKISLIVVSAFILVIIINSVIRGDKLDPNDPRPPGPLYNYWIPEDTVEDWNEMHYLESDEYQMWITGEGDTIWE